MDIAVKLAGLEKAPSDSGIHVEGENIKKVLFGVDMDTPEIMLGKQLGYDCVITHHPRVTDSDILEVLDGHIDKLEKLGVPRNKSQKRLTERREELGYNTHVSNSRRSESAAKLLDMPFMSIHQPADIISENVVQKLLDDKFADNNKTKISDIIEALEEIGEYKNSYRKPVVRVGNKDSYAGKIYVLMSGLTGPGAKVLKEYFEAGVGTLVMMHIPEKDAKELKEHGIGNVVVAGHLSSDSIGMNLIAEEWAKHGVETTMMSGVVAK